MGQGCSSRYRGTGPFVVCYQLTTGHIETTADRNIVLLQNLHKQRFCCEAFFVNDRFTLVFVVYNNLCTALGHQVNTNVYDNHSCY